jgi:hypothetical protein
MPAARFAYLVHLRYWHLPTFLLSCRPVAERGAMLFFLLNSLNKIHAFYQYR